MVVRKLRDTNKTHHNDEFVIKLQFIKSMNQLNQLFHSAVFVTQTLVELRMIIIPHYFQTFQFVSKLKQGNVIYEQ